MNSECWSSLISGQHFASQFLIWNSFRKFGKFYWYLSHRYILSLHNESKTAVTSLLSRILLLFVPTLSCPARKNRRLLDISSLPRRLKVTRRKENPLVQENPLGENPVAVVVEEITLHLKKVQAVVVAEDILHLLRVQQVRDVVKEVRSLKVTIDLLVDLIQIHMGLSALYSSLIIHSRRACLVAKALRVVALHKARQTRTEPALVGLLHSPRHQWEIRLSCMD